MKESPALEKFSFPLFDAMASHTELVLGVWQHLDAIVSAEGSKPITLTGRSLTIPDIVSIAR